MAKYIIDTNTCIEYFKHRHGVAERMSQADRDDLCVSEVTIAELLYFDILIGATARHYGLIAVTDNLKHFNPMPGVQVENWVNRDSEN